MSRRKKTLLTLTAVIAGLALFGIGYWVGVGLHLGQTAAGVSYALQDTVLKHLEDSYYQPVDPSALESDAISGMVAGLNDPYTVYPDPSEYANLTGELSGSYTGIGLAEEMVNGLITTLSVFKGSPAAAAGIQPGDIIVSVDGVPAAGMTIDQVVAKIQGQSGTSVTLGMYRPPAGYTATTTTTTTVPGQVAAPAPVAKGSADLPPGGTTREYTLVRREITEPQVDSTLLTTNGEKVADITLYIFSSGAADALRAAVKKAVETDKVAAIILDIEVTSNPSTPNVDAPLQEALKLIGG